MTEFKVETFLISVISFRNFDNQMIRTSNYFGNGLILKFQFKWDYERSD